MENASEIYTSCIVCREELIEEKINVFADMIYHLNTIYFKHANSKYVGDAITYLYAYSMQFMVELQREHTIYEEMINYIESFEFITDLDDEEILSNMSDVLDRLEEAMEQRIMYYANFLNRVDDIMMWPVLTNNSYYIPSFTATLTDEDANEMINSFVRTKK